MTILHPLGQKVLINPRKKALRSLLLHGLAASIQLTMQTATDLSHYRTQLPTKKPKTCFWLVLCCLGHVVSIRALAILIIPRNTLWRRKTMKHHKLMMQTMNHQRLRIRSLKKVLVRYLPSEICMQICLRFKKKTKKMSSTNSLIPRLESSAEWSLILTQLLPLILTTQHQLMGRMLNGWTLVKKLMRGVAISLNHKITILPATAILKPMMRTKTATPLQPHLMRGPPP